MLDFAGIAHADGTQINPERRRRRLDRGELMRDAVEIERAVAAFARSPNGGLILTGSGLANVHRDLISRCRRRPSTSWPLTSRPPRRLLFEYSTSGKWLELLKEIAPGVTRVAVLRDLRQR
jgi:hypothetical protein